MDRPAITEIVDELKDTDNCNMCVYNHTHPSVMGDTDDNYSNQNQQPPHHQVFTELKKDNPGSQQPIKDMVQLTPVPVIPINLPVVQDIHSLQNTAPNLQPLDTQPMSIPAVQTTPKGDSSLQTVTALPVLQSGSDVVNSSSMFVEHYLITKVIEKTPAGQQVKSESTLQLTPSLPPTQVIDAPQSVIDLSTTGTGIGLNPHQTQQPAQFINTNAANENPQILEKSNTDYMSLSAPAPTIMMPSANALPPQVQSLQSQHGILDDFSSNGVPRQESANKTLVTPAEFNVRMEHIPAIIAANPDKKITILPSTDGAMQPSIVKISTDKGYIELPCGMEGKLVPIVSTSNFTFSSTNAINTT